MIKKGNIMILVLFNVCYFVNGELVCVNNIIID